MQLSDIKKATSTSSSVSSQIKVSSLSAPINGKFGTFRQFTVGDANYNVDDKRVSGAQMFTPNCTAVVTLNKYTNKENKEVTVISQLTFEIPQASGFFVMK